MRKTIKTFYLKYSGKILKEYLVTMHIIHQIKLGDNNIQATLGASVKILF